MATRAFHLLIVDDDPLIHQSFRLCLPAHWKPVSATKISEIPDRGSFHAAFVDMHLVGDQPLGLQVLENLRRDRPTTELVAMSGDLGRSLMEASLKAGAQRFLGKPLQSEELLLVLRKIEALWDLRQGASRREGTRWIGDGAESRRIIARLASLKGEPGPVLIEGESGCGKEVVARLLHEQEDGERPLIAVNVAALPEALFESELFGHVKGAFTGADREKTGLAEAADGGDLFLDEVEALPPALQVKLLRFLESGEIRRVGSTQPTRVRCRVIAATNRPLEALVKEGAFREDLYFRLAAQRVALPPLRERADDIAALAWHFLENERPRRHKTLADDGLAALKKHPWPGNVRELKRVIERLGLSSPLPLIRAEDVAAILGSAPASGAGAIDLARGLAALLEDFERAVLKKALEKEPDVEKAAALLGVSRSNLYKKIKDFQLEQT